MTSFRVEETLRKILMEQREQTRLLGRWFEEWKATNVPPTKPVATGAHLVINPTQGDNMPGTITVDTTNETVTFVFDDSHGDTDVAEPTGAVVAFASSDPAVATIAVDATNPLVGDIAVVAEGTSSISALVTNPDGTPFLEADGVTPFPTPDPVTVTVTAGAAVGDKLVLSV